MSTRWWTLSTYSNDTSSDQLRKKCFLIRYKNVFVSGFDLVNFVLPFAFVVDKVVCVVVGVVVCVVVCIVGVGVAVCAVVCVVVGAVVGVVVCVVVGVVVCVVVSAVNINRWSY